MTFLERPMAIDSADVCVWRDAISGPVIANEGTGGSTYDLTSSGGVSVDTMAAAFFSAIATTSQYYLTGNLPQFSMANGFTMSLWVRATILGSLDRCLLKQNQATWTAPQFDVAIMTNSSSDLGGGDLANLIPATGADDFRAGEWVHAGVTIDSTDSVLKFYLRGVLIGTAARTSNLGSDDGPWILGGRVAGDNFPGHIWDARIALTERPLSWFENSYIRGLRFFGSS